jgi:AcrR family transcriptional regulator
MGTTERREREKLRRRQDILETARGLFFQKGFRDTTIDDIAHATELARGTIYLYFESKEEIYAAALEEGLDLLDRLIHDSFNPDLDPLTNVLAGHDAFMRFHDEYPHYYHILTLDRMQIIDVIPADLKNRIDAKMDAMSGWIAKNLEDGIRKGVFRPMAVREVAILQMGIAMGVAQMLDKCPAGTSYGAERDQLRQSLHDLVAMGLIAR